MSAQENTPDAGSPDVAVSADSAVSALQGVEAAQARARLQAGIWPAWLGPTRAAIVMLWWIGTGVGTSIPVWLPLGVIALEVLSQVGRRRTGVLVSWSWSSFSWQDAIQAVLAVFSMFGAWGLAAVLCLEFGVGGLTRRIAEAVAMGLTVWAFSIWLRVTAKKKLRRLG